MKHITENISVYDYSAKIMPGVHFPVRSTLIELNKKELVIISPGPFEEAQMTQLIKQYQTVYCIAPNAFHHLHLEKFHQTFPNITLYGPSSIIKKQPWLKNKLADINLLGSRLKDNITLIPIHGNKLLDETVFYCCRSKSLIVTDLLFNMRDPMPFGRKCLLRLVGANNRIAQSKLIEKSTKNKVDYVNSVNVLKGFDISRIIMAHGSVIETESEIEEALRVIGVH